MSSAPDAESIDAMLVEAFGAAPKPPREALINLHCEECLETSAAFADKRWQDVTIDDIERGKAIELLTVPAWRYYLPALIRWCLRDARAADDWLHFLPNALRHKGGDAARVDERHTGFDDLQRAAIVAYLEWCVRREAARADGVSATLERDTARLRRALAFWSNAR